MVYIIFSLVYFNLDSFIHMINCAYKLFVIVFTFNEFFLVIKSG